jgi:hypothetical protein
LLTSIEARLPVNGTVSTVRETLSSTRLRLLTLVPAMIALSASISRFSSGSSIGAAERRSGRAWRELCMG